MGASRIMFKKKRQLTATSFFMVNDFFEYVKVHKIKQKDIQQIIKEGEEIILFYWVVEK